MTENFQELTRSVLFGTDARPVRERFLKEYKTDIDQFIAFMDDAFIAWKSLDSKIGSSQTGAHISALVYGGLNTHVVSMKLFLDGLIVPAGNAQRYVLESVAMAFLAASQSLDFFERYSKGQYSTSKAIRDLKRNAEKLGVSPEAVMQLEEHSKHYDQYSHPTLLSLIALMTLNGPKSELVFGSVYDPGKKYAYDKEIKSRVSLASTFPNFIQGVDENFNSAA